MEMVIGTCSKCKKEKEVYPDSSVRADICHGCYASIHRNPVLQKAVCDKWRAKHREYWKGYYERNKETIKKSSGEYYAANRTEIMKKKKQKSLNARVF